MKKKYIYINRTHLTMQVSTLFEDFGRILYKLPPNTTHILQPADVGAFGPLKRHWQTVVGDARRADINLQITRNELAPL